MPVLWHKTNDVEVDRALLDVSSARCHWRDFRMDSGRASIRISQSSMLDEKKRKPLTGSLAPWGFVQIENDEILAHIPNDVWAAESVLRIAYQYATVKSGGILVHATAVGWNGHAVVALGQSGAGKSTLAALCGFGEGQGTILSDEIIQLYPDGTCAGTPFRSNLENVGSPGIYKIASLLTLHHALEEMLTPISPAVAMTSFLPQVYRSDAVPVSNAEILKRLGACMDKTSLHRLSFRKHEAVGPFLREWVGANARG